jgi:hypothetical protein
VAGPVAHGRDHGGDAGVPLDEEGVIKAVAREARDRARRRGAGHVILAVVLEHRGQGLDAARVDDLVDDLPPPRKARLLVTLLITFIFLVPTIGTTTTSHSNSSPTAITAAAVPAAISVTIIIA